jgi:phage-related protein (TIGR01555 family)
MTRRLDSWTNALTGLGHALRDKLQSTLFQSSPRLPDATLEALFCESDIAARICDALPRGALRNGFYVSAEETDLDLATEMSMYLKRCGFSKALMRAAVWARVFGGSAVYVLIDDGQAEDQPVGDAVRSIKKCSVVDRRYLLPKSHYETLERYGEPETYELSGRDGLQITIHESRLLRFDGVDVPQTRSERNNGWGDSVLERPYQVIRDFGMSWQATSHLMADAAQGKFKIQGLVDMIAGGEKDALQARMQLVDMSRSVCRAVLLDAEKEDYERDPYNFAGIPDILRLFMLRVAAAARMPVTVLMGQSPAGMNATGESDLRIWYDEIKDYQKDSLQDPIERFYRLVFSAEDFSAEEPEGWELRFGRLWQMSDKEQAEVEKITAEKDAIYIREAVLSPEEVALNRFRAAGFSTDTQIDLDIREELLEADQKKAIETKDDPDPEPSPVGDPPDAENA